MWARRGVALLVERLLAGSPELLVLATSRARLLLPFERVGTHLAALADHSLLVSPTTGDGTRYRALETVRQYGAELLDDAGELMDSHRRHLQWALAEGEALLAAPDFDTSDDTSDWRAAFDQLADELRAAVRRADRSGHRSTAHDVATVLAALCYRRGLPGEAQWRYEQAGGFAPTQNDPAVAELSERAMELGGRCGDPMTASAALDRT